MSHLSNMWKCSSIRCDRLSFGAVLSNTASSLFLLRSPRIPIRCPEFFGRLPPYSLILGNCCARWRREKEAGSPPEQKCRPGGRRVSGTSVFPFEVAIIRPGNAKSQFHFLFSAVLPLVPVRD